MALFAGRLCTGRDFFSSLQAAESDVQFRLYMDVLTVIKGCDVSFGFGIWKGTEVLTELMALSDS